MKTLLFWNIIALLIGIVMDLAVGDPENQIHLVIVYGYLIKLFEDMFYPHRYKRRLYGALLVIV
ncbi:MAG: hypothetical protein IJL69_00740, partial [Oscillospiraceae bacterium]|nr:hypothetical protein [Oscillospiraceae bacterium]